MSRPRDYAYEALAEVTGTDMNAGRGELNAALKSIREQSEIQDSYILADEIHERGKMYRKVMPDVMLTPSALSKHWLRVFEESHRPQGTNISAPLTDCPTCQGDRFVVYALRAGEIEEYAPCPNCNADVDTSFWRANGTRFVGPDPAKVRERL